MALVDGKLHNLEELAQVMYEGWRKSKLQARKMALRCAQDISHCREDEIPPEPPTWDELQLEQLDWVSAADAVRKTGILKE
jgi:hypothetical protein